MALWGCHLSWVLLWALRMPCHLFHSLQGCRRSRTLLGSLGFPAVGVEVLGQLRGRHREGQEPGGSGRESGPEGCKDLLWSPYHAMTPKIPYNPVLIFKLRRAGFVQSPFLYGSERVSNISRSHSWGCSH